MLAELLEWEFVAQFLVEKAFTFKGMLKNLFFPTSPTFPQVLIHT